MISKEVVIIFPLGLTKEEIKELLILEHEKIEKNGGRIIEEEPIEKVYVVVIGRKIKYEQKESKDGS